MENKKLELVIFSAMFVALTVLLLFVFRPFMHILVVAAVLAVLFHPVYKKMVKKFPKGRSTVSAVLVIVALIFIIIPLLFIGFQIFNQAQGFFALTDVSQGQYIQDIQNNVNGLITHIGPSFSFSVSDTIAKVQAYVSANIGGLVSQTAYIFFQTFFLLFALFFFLRDGEQMLDSVFSLSPFGREHSHEITDTTSRTIVSVIRGTLFVGLIRFALFAAAFYILGIPNALLWATVGGVIAIIPGLGTAFVVIPGFIYLILYGNIFTAIGILVFGGLVFFFIDNLLSAYFFGKGLDVPPPFILFSILGGVLFFGPLGFIFGPIILSLFVLAMHMYKVYILKKA
jgi:predicted PurR-regulated permease PerM